MVRLRAPRPGALELRRSPSSTRRRAALIANPGCYATAALLALAPLADAIDPTSVVVDAKSGVSGAGRELKASSHAGFVLENVSPYASARTSTRRRSRRRSASPSASSRTCCRCAAACSRPVTSGRPPTLRELLEDAYASSAVVRVLPEGVAPELARVQHTDAPRSRSSRTASTGTRSSCARSTTSARARPGQAIQNANLALGLDETLGLRLAAECSYERHGAAKGFVASGVHCGIRKKDRPRPRARALDRARDRCGDVHGEPHARPRR